MKTIHEVLKAKEELLAKKAQEIKLLEAQVAKLRGAIEVMDEEQATDILQVDTPPASGRATSLPSQSPSRNWP